MCTGESGPQCQLSDNEIYGKTSCFESFKFLFLSLLSLSLSFSRYLPLMIHRSWSGYVSENSQGSFVRRIIN